MVKNLPANAGDTGSIPGLGRSTRRGNGNPLQCSCLENPRDGGPWHRDVKKLAQVHTASKQQKWDSNSSQIEPLYSGKAVELLKLNSILFLYFPSLLPPGSSLILLPVRDRKSVG